jgi:hypothetical protein
VNRKIKNTLALFGILVLLLVIGFSFIFLIQRPSIKKKTVNLKNLKSHEYNTDVLNRELADKVKQANRLDSILAARKFNIPKNISPLRFYEFMNKINGQLSADSKLDIEYIERKVDKNFFYYEYKMTGYGDFNDVYQIIYAIEESKELKKILNISLSNYILSTETSEPEFLVNYVINVGVYFSDNDRFASAEYVENNLRAPHVYDVFYPLVRTQIPPNVEGLLDVQGARLLAIVPDGVFLSDLKGESYLLMEGDKVYLGYLTQIDRKNNKARFVLNKGGIVESVEIPLEKEIQKTVK